MFFNIHKENNLLLHGLPRNISSKTILNSSEYKLFTIIKEYLKGKHIPNYLIDIRSDENRKRELSFVKRRYEVSKNDYKNNKNQANKERLEKSRLILLDFKKEKPEPEHIAALRKKYHGLSSLAKKLTNTFIKVIYSNVDQESIKIARRFSIKNRSLIFKFISLNKRYKQFVEAFPLLGLAAAVNFYSGDKQIADRIERGFKLKQIANESGMPMAFRNVKPQSCGIILTNINSFINLHNSYNEIFSDHMPTKTMEQYRWLVVLSHHIHFQNLGWLRWLSRATVRDYKDETLNKVTKPTRSKLADLVSKVQLMRDAFAYEPWDYKVSWQGGFKRQAEWHHRENIRRQLEAERMRLAMRGVTDNEYKKLLEERERIKKLPFPEPWLPDLKDNAKKYSIIALTSQEELENEGLVMHHCVADYATDIEQNICCIYSVRENDKSIATLELRKINDKKCYLNQLRGKCNSTVDGEVSSLVNNWINSSNKNKSGSNKHKLEINLEANALI